MAKIEISKIKGAQRQIDAAVRMLLDNEDPVAIHTLAHAALSVLRDLAEHAGIHSVWDKLEETIKPEMKKRFNREYRKLANFLKHADNDPEDSISNVDESINLLTLFICCQLYEDLGAQKTSEMMVLVTMFLALNPDAFEDKVPLKAELDVIVQDAKDIGPEEFRSLCKSLLIKIKT